METKDKERNERIKEFEKASRLLYGSGCNDLYMNLRELYRNYAELFAEHDPKYGDFPGDKASQDLFTIRQILENIEPLIDDYLDFNCKDKV